MKFLEWLIRDETAEAGPISVATPAAAAILKSDEFHNATPYNKAFYETMFKVAGTSGRCPEYAELLIEMADTASTPTS